MPEPEKFDVDAAADRRDLRGAVVMTLVALAAVLVACTLIAVSGAAP